MNQEEITSSREPFEKDFVGHVRRINDFCLDYGCFFEVSWLSGANANDLEAYVTDPQRGQDSKSDIYQEINEWFTALEYRPFERAHFIYRAQQTPVFREFSHHLERGLLLYYKGDFFSAVQVLVPAVEGILRLYVGGGPMEIGKGLVDKIQHVQRSLPHPEFALRHSAFKDILEQFLRKWFFARSDDPTLTTIPSKMNRNYISHLAGTDAFYRPSDCNRLFAFFDVMLEVVTLEHAEVAHFISLPEEGIPEVTERMNYYSYLMSPLSPWHQIRDVEERSMAQNPRYESSRVPDWAGILAAQQVRWEAMLRDIREGRERVPHKTPPRPLQPRFDPGEP